MKGLHSQRGVTGITMIFMLALLAFFVLIALRLFPIYLEHFKVSSHLERFAAETWNNKMTDNDIRRMLQKRFDIDDVVHATTDDIFIEHSKNGPTVIAIEYEVRTPAMGNVDMVVSFVDEAKVGP